MPSTTAQLRTQLNEVINLIAFREVDRDRAADDVRDSESRLNVAAAMLWKAQEERLRLEGLLKEAIIEDADY